MAIELSDLPPLRETMQRYGLEPKKSLGQNFLLDGNITDKVARAAGNLSQIHVIEVGPGPGGLTRSLLRAGAKTVIAVEKDSRCIAALAEIADIVGQRLRVVEADALTINPADLTPAPRAIVANLPYNIATPLLIRWLELIAADAKSFSGLTLMFQKEVAARITVGPGTKEYGRLSVMTQWLCRAEHVFDLPPSVFTPPPKVTSSVIHIVPRETPLVDVPWKVMERVVEKAFNQRRKMLRSALKGLVEKPESLLDAAGIDPTLRAEQLSVQSLGLLAQKFLEYRGG